MGKISILGNQNPQIGIPQQYSLFKTFEFSTVQSPVFDVHNEVAHWEIHVLERGNWRKTDGNSKTGDSVIYTFNQKSLTRKGIKIVVIKGKDKSGLIIKTKPAGQPKINKIELLDVNKHKVTKPLSYMDTLYAKAYCTDMEGESLFFTLWEDDAIGAGHSKTNQINKINTFPVPARVKKGIAEAKFNMAQYAMASMIANMQVAKGDKNEGKTHEYYVTAEYFGKLQASNNIDINNPASNTSPQKVSAGSQPKTPTSAQPKTAPKPPNKIPTPPAPTPKRETYKKPITSKAKTKAPDAKGRIKEVSFLDFAGRPLEHAQYGTTVTVKIIAQNMKGKTVKLKIWEDDVMNQLVLEKNYILAGDESFIKLPLTQSMQHKGDDWKEGSTQELFLEVEYAGQSINSEVINVDEKAPPRKIETGRSKAVVKVEKKEENSNECFCKKQENQFYWSNKLTCEGRKKVLQVCSNLWGEDKKKQKASELMAIMHVETAATFNPAIDNGAGYSGLIQFSDASAKRVGTTRAKLKAMTFVEQMDYVEKYLKDKKDQLNTMTDLYLMVLKTNAVGQGSNPNYVLFDESISVPNVPFDKNNLTKEPWVTKYGYASNPTYMVEKGEYENKRQFQTYSKGFKEKRGFAGGKTYVWEVTNVLTKKHYNLGKLEIFNGKCENIKEERKKSDGKRAPWVDVAYEEYETYKNYVEKENPLKEHISEYFKGTGNGDLDYTAPWCAAFIKWCFDHTEDYKNSNTNGTAAAFDWAEYQNSKVIGNKYVDGWKNGERCDPFVGAIITFTFSHTAIIVGENLKGDKYVYLGGNQGNGDARSGYQKICLGSISKNSSKIFMIMKPKTYDVNDEEKKLPKLNVEAENSAGSSR